MHPSKIDRKNLTKLTDLPNIGKAGREDLLVLGINKPEDLIGRDPYQLHTELCVKTGIQHDVCVIDVFISIVRFMHGEKPQAWWHYTRERKDYLQKQAEKINS